MSVTGYDPYEPATLEDPYPSYAWLRDEAPVYRQPAHGFFVVSRYEDVVAVVRNPADFSSARGVGPTVIDNAVAVLERDPPDHTRLRRLLQKAFTPRAVAAWEDRIREISVALLDKFVANTTGDFMTDFAAPLPVIVIAEMLGVEPDRLDDFKRWSHDVVDALVANPALVDRTAMYATLGEMLEFFATIIDERRQHPRDDLVSALVQAREEDDRLTALEINAFMILLLVAGNETTTNLIGNTTMIITASEERRAVVRDEPSLWPAVVEEVLRFDSPIQGLFRTTTRDVVLHDTEIPAGSKVLALFGSANRDPRRFPDPDRFDPRRDVAGHVAFGSGIHLCLGAPLARLEGRVALETVTARIRNVRLTAQPSRRPNAFFRGFEHLPIGFDVVG